MRRPDPEATVVDPSIEFVYVLHPLDGDAGWRWAVYIGVELLEFCVNSGGRPTRLEADLDGQTVLYSLLNLMHIVGGQTSVVNVEHDHDPTAGQVPAAVGVAPHLTVLR